MAATWRTSSPSRGTTARGGQTSQHAGSGGWASYGPLGFSRLHGQAANEFAGRQTARASHSLPGPQGKKAGLTALRRGSAHRARQRVLERIREDDLFAAFQAPDEGVGQAARGAAGKGAGDDGRVAPGLENGALVGLRSAGLRTGEKRGAKLHSRRA